LPRKKKSCSDVTSPASCVLDSLKSVWTHCANGTGVPGTHCFFRPFKLYQRHLNRDSSLKIQQTSLCCMNLSHHHNHNDAPNNYEQPASRRHCDLIQPPHLSARHVPRELSKVIVTDRASSENFDNYRHEFRSYANQFL
jgi:hypothetical protein